MKIILFDDVTNEQLLSYDFPYEPTNDEIELFCCTKYDTITHSEKFKDTKKVWVKRK